jgi:C1A family cysteine protease
MDIFAKNDAYIRERNLVAENTFVLDHNMFSTMTQDEIEGRLGKKGKMTANETMEFSAEDLQDSVDWRTKGAVNPVQNQGQCGSCWAFSSTAAIESAHFLKTGELLKLSEQQFVDCDKRSSGCNGGLEIWAFAYAQKSAIELETAYPYTARNGRCTATAKDGKVSVTSYSHVTDRSVTALKAAITKQPVCVSVDASGDFMLYSGGILSTSAKCGTALNHAVTAVGYGTENGQDYFIVRNSWGTSWGEDGYIRVATGSDGQSGVCGILLDSNVPQTN